VNGLPTGLVSCPNVRGWHGHEPCSCLGRRYTCPRCKRFVPFCYGAADDHSELCDDCWGQVTKEEEMAKKTKPEIDWLKVEQMMRRGKLGRLIPGDEELISHAYKADREKYGELKRRVDGRVTDEIKKRGF